MLIRELILYEIISGSITEGGWTMVTFDICEGNPGAIAFLIEAYDMSPGKAEFGFARMQAAAIRV